MQSLALRRSIRTFVALAAAALPLAAGAAAQEQKPEVDLSRLEVYLDKAVNGSAFVRPQAAQRLVPMGDAAVARLLPMCGSGPAEMAELGSDLVEVLAAFGDERLRELLWACVDDRDFPWRPAAARSLAAHGPKAEPAQESPRFHALLDDPIAPVRMAAVQALARIHATPPAAVREAVRARLADGSDFVRRAAAVALVGWGEPERMLWLLEDLRRSDTYFDNRTGTNAAYESRRALAELLGESFGFDPELPPGHPANDEALAAIEKSIRARIGERELPELPAVARPAPAIDDAVLGLALQSCRRGEYYLRWTAGDELLVGMGNPARVKLPAGTTARLAELARAGVAELDRPFFGEPGCDIEQLRIADSPGGTARVWIVSKGQAMREGLRPQALTRVMLALVESIPSEIESADPRLADLRRSTREAMAAIGG